MKFVVIRDKDCFGAIKLFDQCHTVTKTKGKADGGEGIAVNRMVGDDCNTEQIVITRVSGFGI